MPPKHAPNLSNAAAQAPARASVKKSDARLMELRALANLAVEALGQMLGDEEQFFRHAYTEKSTGETMEARLKLANVKQLRETIGAIRELTDAIRSLYGLPTVQEAAALSLSKRKLKLDEQKLRATDLKAEGETGVVILPGEAAQSAGEGAGA